MARDLIDERTAILAARLVTPHRRTAPEVAARLRDDVLADVPVLDEVARAWTRLGTELPPTNVRVVSRLGWVEANLRGLRGALVPLSGKVTNETVTGAALSVQLGVLLGLLSTKVLGQYVLPLGGPGQAQLVVVGPNLVDLTERHGALASDVRRIILLHELTHRLQFDAVPWLGDHLRGLLERYLEASRLDVTALVEAIGRLPDVVRALREEHHVAPLLRLVLTDEQRVIVEEAQALMTLLEGHGNAAMYGAADGAVRDPDRVRDALERRRTAVRGKVLRAVAGHQMNRRE
jgi:coenzyme F420 biosynthesis associated uncharacterized protein